MIDLHCHILPGLDDGPAQIENTLAMAMVAVADGVRTIAATPRVGSGDPLPASSIGRAVGATNVALARMEIPLAVVPGAELTLGTLAGADPDILRPLGLGGSRTVLLESPFAQATEIEDVIDEAQDHGLRVLLAHPERSPAFQDDIDRLARLEERGVLCAVSAGSMVGRSGKKARQTAIELFRRDLVHVVTSSGHDDNRRPPRLTDGFAALEEELPELQRLTGWLTRDVPEAILTDADLPERPAPKTKRFRLFRRDKP